MKQHVARVRIYELLAGLLRLVGRPAVKVADELRQRERALRRQVQTGRMGGKLAERDAPDIATPLKLGDIVGDRIVEVDFALFGQERQQRGIEDFADRCKIEQRI